MVPIDGALPIQGSWHSQPLRGNPLLAAAGNAPVSQRDAKQSLDKEDAPLESPVAIAMIAVSDDASVVVTKDSAGAVEISNGDTSWRPFYGAYSPLAWAFIPKTHDLIISDSQEKAVFRIEPADSKNTRTVLAENCLPNRLAMTSAGETLAAVDSRRSILWTIDLKSRISTLPSQPKIWIRWPRCATETFSSPRPARRVLLS